MTSWIIVKEEKSQENFILSSFSCFCFLALLDIFPSFQKFGVFSANHSARMSSTPCVYGGGSPLTEPGLLPPVPSFLL